MEPYTLPREAFDVLEQSLGGKQKAEVLARTLEAAISAIQQKANEEFLEQKQFLKIVLKDELKQELVTREIFEDRFKGLEEKFEGRFKGLEEKFEGRFKGLEEKFEGRFKGLEEKFEGRFQGIDERFKGLENTMLEKFKVVDEKFSGLHFKMNLFIAIALIALTFANPTFVQLLEKIF
jgi:hypothetical protein